MRGLQGAHTAHRVGDGTIRCWSATYYELVTISIIAALPSPDLRTDSATVQYSANFYTASSREPLYAMATRRGEAQDEITMSIRILRHPSGLIPMLRLGYYCRFGWRVQ